jgi:hypothetical protein
VALQPLHLRRVVDRVDLIGGNDLRLGRNRGIELPELLDDRLEVLDRIAARGARDINQVHEHFRALDVAQELMPQPVPLVRAFDEPRHVGDHEAAIAAERDHAQVRLERRERIVGDLRSRGGDT